MAQNDATYRDTFPVLPGVKSSFCHERPTVSPENPAPLPPPPPMQVERPSPPPHPPASIALALLLLPPLLSLLQFLTLGSLRLSEQVKQLVLYAIKGVSLQLTWLVAGYCRT